MAEDSGAFKTIPANSRQIPAFYHDSWTAVATKPGSRKAFPAHQGHLGAALTPLIFN
jgi:hypothetical protein